MVGTPQLHEDSPQTCHHPFFPCFKQQSEHYRGENKHPRKRSLTPFLLQIRNWTTNFWEQRWHQYDALLRHQLQPPLCRDRAHPSQSPEDIVGTSHSGSTSMTLLAACSLSLVLLCAMAYIPWGYTFPSSLFREIQGQALAHTALHQGKLWLGQSYKPGVSLGLTSGDRSAAAAARRSPLHDAMDHQPLTHVMQ